MNKYCNKVFAEIHSLNKLQRFLRLHIKLLLIRTFIFPHLTYCSCVVNDIAVALGDKLQDLKIIAFAFAYDLKT